MAYFMIATIVDTKYSIIGYRLIDTKNDNFKHSHPCYADVEKGKVLNLLSKGNEIENLKLQGNKIVSTGSIERYPKLSLSGELLSKPSYTVISVNDTSVILCSHTGIAYSSKLSELYKRKIKLSNAKLVNQGGKLFISSLSNGHLIRGSRKQGENSNTSNTSNPSNKITTNLRHRKYQISDSLYKSGKSCWVLNTHGGTKVSIEYDIASPGGLLDMIKRIPTMSDVNLSIDDMTPSNGGILSHSIEVTPKGSNTALNRRGLFFGNAVYFCGWVLDSSDYLSGAIGITEVSLSGNDNYLLIYSSEDFLWRSSRRYLVLHDILHIGKRYTQLGASEQEQKASYNSNDSSIIGLGLYGLVMIEYTSEELVLNKEDKQKVENRHRPNIIWENFDIKCVPYYKLKTRDDVIRALSSLRTLDRNSISNYDIDFIINAKHHIKSYKDDFEVLESLDGHKFTRLFDGCEGCHLNNDNAVTEILCCRDVTSTGTYDYELHRDSFGIIHASKMNELEASIGNHFGCIHEQKDKLYINCTGLYAIEFLFGGVHSIRTYSYVELRIVGYIALYKSGNINAVYTDWLPSDAMNNIASFIWKVSLSGDILEVGYSAYKIFYKYSDLMELYTSASAKILSNMERTKRFNSKQAILGNGIKIDRNGIIIDCAAGSYIKQDGHIRGIDAYCKDKDKEVTIELTDSFNILYRFRNWHEVTFANIHIVVKKDGLESLDRLNTDDSIPCLSCSLYIPCVKSLTFDFDGISNSEELHKMLSVYLAFVWGTEIEDSEERGKSLHTPDYRTDYTLSWFMLNIDRIWLGSWLNYPKEDAVLCDRAFHYARLLAFNIQVYAKNISSIDKSISLEVLDKLSKYLNIENPVKHKLRGVFYKSLYRWLIGEKIEQA